MSTPHHIDRASEARTNRGLLLLACTATKRSDSGLMPAIQRYNGPSFRVLRKWQSANPTDAAQIDILILSAKFGLIGADAPIAGYDQRMTPDRATELQQPVSAALTHFVAQHGPYTATLIHLGKDYMPAIVPEQFQGAPFGHVTFTKGGIGRRLGQIKQWLSNVENHMANTPTRRDWVVNVYADEHDEDRVTEAWIIHGRTEHEAQQEVEAETGSDYSLTPAESWHIRWAAEGDDMACPNCEQDQLQTQDRVTCCRACGWQAHNPLAL